jgi:hypothetical protein
MMLDIGHPSNEQFTKLISKNTERFKHLCASTGWLPAAERGQATYPPLPGTKMFETLCMREYTRCSLCRLIRLFSVHGAMRRHFSQEVMQLFYEKL